MHCDFRRLETIEREVTFKSATFCEVAIREVISHLV